MGLLAKLYAIGKFSKEIIPYLDYPEDFYDDVVEGVLIHTTLYSCNTTGESKELALALGTNPWDFNTHFIIKDNIDFDALGGFEFNEDQFIPETVRVLIDRGFQLIYCPDG